MSNYSQRMQQHFDETILNGSVFSFGVYAEHLFKFDKHPLKHMIEIHLRDNDISHRFFQLLDQIVQLQRESFSDAHFIGEIDECLEAFVAYLLVPFKNRDDVQFLTYINYS